VCKQQSRDVTSTQLNHYKRFANTSRLPEDRKNVYRNRWISTYTQYHGSI